MSLINDQRILLLEITNEFTRGKKPLNEVIEYFYNHKVATEIKNKSILEWGKIFLNLSNKGLQDRNFENKDGKNETIFLKNVEQILQQNKTKAEKTPENFN